MKERVASPQAISRKQKGDLKTSFSVCWGIPLTSRRMASFVGGSKAVRSAPPAVAILPILKERANAMYCLMLWSLQPPPGRSSGPGAVACSIRNGLR
jgi:hypothetical protein